MATQRSEQAIYTILFGGYEDLRPQPILADSSIRAVCLTDDPNLVSDEWEVVLVERKFPTDIIRSQRFLKICFEANFSEYSEVLYVDNTVLLKELPETILDNWLADADVALMQHSFRRTLLDEFDEVARLSYDDTTRVHEQLWDYSQTFPHVLSDAPLWTGFLARRNSPSVNAAMNVWWEHVLRYSRRDQLSVMTALQGDDVSLNLIIQDNFNSDWHEWGVSGSRRVHLGKAPALPAGPLLAELHRTKHELQAGHAMIDSLNADILNLEQSLEKSELEFQQVSMQKEPLLSKQSAKDVLRKFKLLR